MKPPKIIYVGPHDYDVKVTKNLGDALFGETDNTNSEILLHSKQSPSNRRDTLLHEALHAIVFVSGLAKVHAMDNQTEEQFVRTLTPWLLQLLQDNPELVAYLTEQK